MAGLTRRSALQGVAAGALATAIAVAVPEAPAVAAVAAVEESVRGSWVITPKPGGAIKPFTTLGAFAAGGVFITTGSDEPGTGIGAWSSTGTNTFSFAYTNFHFDPAGLPSHTVTLKATGTFKGATMTGQATLTVADPAGKPKGPTATVQFTGQRMVG